MADERSFGRSLLIFSIFWACYTEDSVLAKSYWRNVAIGKSVFQSSTSAENVAELSIDNDVTTCSRTAKEKRPWVKIDLGEKHVISAFRIITAGESVSRINFFTSNNQYNPDESSCKYYSRDIASESLQECYSTPNARYFYIQAATTKFISFCEIELLECHDNYFGKMCNQTCHCKDGALCNKDKGQCPEDECEAGYKGVDCQEECPTGTFGLGCSSDCHCSDNQPCLASDGTCSVTCAAKYLGASCQTEIPSVKLSPELLREGPQELKIQWRTWTKHVDQQYEIFYKVKYRPSTGHRTWIMTDEIPLAIGQINQDFTITDLKYSTHYTVNIVPYIRQTNNNEVLNGVQSPSTRAFKTGCAEPAQPEILEISSAIDEDSKTSAMLIIKWRELTNEEAHCNSLTLYKVKHRTETSNEWTVASTKRGSFNLTGLEFSTPYNVKIIAMNNERLESDSFVRVAVTVDQEPEVGGVGIGVIIGIAVLVILLVVVILSIIIYRRRKAEYDAVSAKGDPEESKVLLNNLTKAQPPKLITPTEDSGVVAGSDDSPSSAGGGIEVSPSVSETVMDSRPDVIPQMDRPIVPRLITVEQLEDVVMSNHANNCQQFREEYKNIPEGFIAGYDIGRRTSNKHKNRFVNIIAYDHTRVVLEPIVEDPDSDYINASYIDGYKKPKAYIAAQGCNKFTIQDVWKMVWQEKSLRILMVTNLVENGKRKCEQYWPESVGASVLYGDTNVKLLDIEHTSDFVIRTFDISQGDETRNIKQFHFTAWPDHGVPHRAGPIIAFRRKVSLFDETHPGTMLVHCSAGVGRTGTYIALDVLLEMAKEEGCIDVFGLAQRMRKERVNMIQTVEQYIFVYDALLEALKSGNTAIACAEFQELYAALCQPDPETGKSPLQQQFETLQCMSPKVKPEDCKSGALTENLEKNRVQTLLPADRHRPYLMTRVQGTNDYINAVFLDGYHSRNAYIITQMPLPHTVIDLWRMVYEHSCGSIVMLNPMDFTTGGQYWPDDETCECGPFEIDPVSVEKPNPEITVRELKLTYQPETSSTMLAGKEEKIRKINMFQLHCWPPDASTPNSRTTLISLIDLVERSQFKTGNGPVLIHCHTGVKQSGLYAAVNCVWEQMKVEQEVDVFHTVKHLRYHRPQIVQDMDQYQFLYEMVLAYQAEFETYANFK